MEKINAVSLKQRLKRYKRSPISLVLYIAVCLSALITLGMLLLLVGHILIKGIPNLSADMFSPEYNSENLSLLPALINTVIMTALSLLLAVPVGVGAAVYLTEYAKRGNKAVELVRITAETLSGIPSIVYGLFGYLFFVARLKLGLSLISGALTLAIIILPLVMRTTEEALKAVPDSFREGSYGLGAGKLRTVFKIVLPSAVSGILSGVILSVGRIVGESAALIYTAGTVSQTATSLLDSTSTLSVHMYLLASEGLHIDKTYATAVVLLIIVVVINGLSAQAAKKLGRGKQG